MLHFCAHKTIVTRAAVVAGALIMVPLMAVPASATDDPVYTKTITSGDGDTVRARFYEHTGGGGAVLTYKGGSACTASISTPEYRMSALPADWNDEISSIRDYNSCDVNLFRDINFGGTQTGYINYGSPSPARNVPSTWNDKASSFYVS